jgi:3-hydroxyisobutyrate dehydrogenase and related beta-hydroxyacid dehydrogenases
MGAPMVRRHLDAGFKVRIWNRSAEKAQPLAAEGATLCQTPAEAAAGASHLVTMLTDGPAVEAVLFELGAADALGAGATVIDMSSIRPGEARTHSAHLAGRGIHHLDAPVSGGTRGAKAGTLAIMAGGGETVFVAAKAVLAPLGRAVRVGPSGAGQLAKLANQAIVGIAIGAVAEATLLVAEGSGDLAAFREALKGGFADSSVLQQHGRRMQEMDFAPGGSAAVQLKDLDNVLAEARALGLTLPLALFLDLLDLNGRSA